MTSIAIMQPYWFPYVGYFQLIQSAEKFIFYDDVNYIKSGWINRNRILVNGEAHYITLSVKDASSFRKINETRLIKEPDKLIRKLEQAYKKAAYFDDVFPIITNHLYKDFGYVSEAAIDSVGQVFQYLGLKLNSEKSSELYRETSNLNREDRLIKICKLTESKIYINPINGAQLYSKDNFQKEGILLKLLEAKIQPYKQSGDTFVPGLSIIDALMFNSKDSLIEMIGSFKLV